MNASTLTIDTPPTQAHDKLAYALLLAVVVHALLLMAVGFKWAVDAVQSSRQMDVTLIHSANRLDDHKARYLAQIAHKSQGHQKPEPQPQPERSSQTPSVFETKPEIHSLQVMTQASPKTTPVVNEIQPQWLAMPSSEPPQTAHHPKRRTISASTHEARDALYLESWRRKIERIGNLNYPSEAKRLGLYGNLRLLVAINKDGSLNDIEILRSSGEPVLDDAAVRIVELSAPFSPLPADMQKDTDVLQIVRTWQFLPTNQLQN